MNISVIKTFTEVEKLNEKINYVVKESTAHPPIILE